MQKWLVSKTPDDENLKNLDAIEFSSIWFFVPEQIDGKKANDPILDTGVVKAI